VSLVGAFAPNRVVSTRTGGLLVVGWAAALLGAWAASPAATLPGPRDVWTALGDLWWRGGLGPELASTVKLVGAATVATVVLSFGIAYASVVPAVRPLTAAVSKLRFLGLTGLVFPFTLATGGGFRLKVALLTFGMTTFLATSLLRVVAEVPRARLDYVRSFGASEARVVWEAVVRGTLDRAIDAVRQNVAMGWSMITMVEGIARSDGGVGALLLAENKHFRLAEVYAVLVVVLIVGLSIDAAMGVLGGLVCPHASYETNARDES
jgi:NitT/TauT family transport system permease protein